MRVTVAEAAARTGNQSDANAPRESSAAENAAGKRSPKRKSRLHVRLRKHQSSRESFLLNWIFAMRDSHGLLLLEQVIAQSAVAGRFPRSPAVRNRRSPGRTSRLGSVTFYHTHPITVRSQSGRIFPGKRRVSLPERYSVSFCNCEKSQRRSHKYRKPERTKLLR